MVGWSVHLAKCAKIAISEPIWLKFGMEAPNSPAFAKIKYYAYSHDIKWLVGWFVCRGTSTGGESQPSGNLKYGGILNCGESKPVGT